MVPLVIILLIVIVGVYYGLDPEKKSLDDSERKKLGGTYIKLSDGITHYKLSGPVDGKIVVLVHGGTVPLWTWDSQIKGLNEAGFRVLCYDKYGRRYSDRPTVIYDQELYQKQLLELLDNLNLTEKINLIGYSLGGGTVVNFAAQNPDRGSKLVLISPVISNYKVPGIFRIPIIGEFTVRLIGIKTIISRFTSLLEGNSDSETYKKLFVEQTTYKGFQQSLLSMLRNNAIKDYTNAYQILGKEKRKILLIWGAEDTEITRKMIKDIRSFLTKLEFKSVTGVGHGIVFQKPQTINTSIIDFLL
ncbi:MAG: alpha/beta hydrolase [Desulfamplus sp.]|nr:alpha/beta hydrolase [Desulfamplus sp.]